MPRKLDSVPPLFVFRLVQALRAWLVRLVGRLVPARVALFEQFRGVWLTQMIHAAAKLGVADVLARGPKTAAELAADTNAHADALERLMRALVSVGVFDRQRDGRYRLNRLASTLRSDQPDSMRDIVLFLGSGPSMQAWERFTDAVRTNTSAFRLVQQRSLFEFLQGHPDDAAVFSGGMANMSELDAPAIVHGFDFSRFSSLCDVGGGSGVMLAAISSKYPKLAGVLFEAAHVAPAASAVFDAWGVADRCRAVTGDFFRDVPAGCDLYILKDIIHDWRDELALTILRNCRQAMAPGAALLIVEMLLVDDNREHLAKLLDMEMLDVTEGGRQRTAAELEVLLTSTGFRLLRVHPLTSPVSVVEAVAV